MTTAKIVLICSHHSPLGEISSAWTDAGLFRLSWGESPDTIVDHASVRSRRWADRLDEKLADYFRSGLTDFSDVKVDPRGWTPFASSVYDHCRRIDPGTNISYKQLALRAGNQLASRAVGSAMARNRVPIVVPCHRVIATSGKLCGFSAPGGLATKQYLIDLETRQSKGER